MAHIFKKPKKGQKGILIFTHKEYDFISKSKNIYEIKKFKTYSDISIGYISLNSSYFLNLFSTFSKKRAIERIKEKYVLGIHYEGKGPNATIKKADWIDFHLNRNPKYEHLYPIVIPYNDEVIVPRVFRNMNLKEKYWDIISISHQARRKGIDILFEQVKRLYEKGIMLNVLLVTVTRKNQNKYKFFNKMTEWYRRIFSREEREYFTLMKLSSDMNFMGLSQRQINYFYNRSKVFVSFSDWEGGPRVVAESILCGLPVVIRKSLSGNYPRLFTNDNCIVVDNCTTAYQKILSAIEKSEKNTVDTSRADKILREDYKLCDLVHAFQDLFDHLGYAFDRKLCNTDHLNQRLNAHWHDNLPWVDDAYGTADITTLPQLEKLYYQCK